MIRRGGVQWAADRPGHDIVALGFVFPAHILEDSNIAAFDEHFVSLRQHREHMRTIVR